MLPFGIPQLDELFGYESLIGEPDAPPPYRHCVTKQTSLSIVGPDGTGKSVFALHLAATYAAITAELWASRGKPAFSEIVAKLGATDQSPIGLPRIIYVSSDLQLEAAETVWRRFCLGFPWDRFVPFISKTDLTFRRGLYETLLAHLAEIKLKHCVPAKPDKSHGAGATAITDFLLESETRASTVAFLDLAGATAGDDWLYVNRLLTLAKRPTPGPPNLLILDSVAGFEALVGDRNSFGEIMSRRARIAQLMRAAGEDWHIVFVVEEPAAGEHHPEEYVTDAVLHLRRHGKADKMRRTLEIEKCRAQAFGAGEHPFEIRSGRGASTGNWEHPDDPHAIRRRFVIQCDENLAGKGVPSNSYVQVFPSLSYLSQSYGEAYQATRSSPETNPHSPLGFGIPSLDELLYRKPTQKGGQERNGLPAGSVTSLTGEEGTRKSRLAEQFLEEAFVEFPIVFRVLLKFVSSWESQDCSAVDEFLNPKQDPIGTQETGSAEENLALITAAFGDTENQYSDTPAGRLVSEWKKAYKDACGDLESPAELAQETQIRILERLYTCPRLECQTAASELRKLLPPSKGGKFTHRPATQTELENQAESPLLRRWDTRKYYVHVEEGVQPWERCFVLALSLMRQSWGILTPVVYVSTSDAQAEQIVNRIIARHESAILKALDRSDFPDSKGYFDERGRFALQRLLERFVLVRRIELSDASAPQLWHIISRNVVHGLYMLGHSGGRVSAVDKAVEHAHTVRVLVSDLRLIRETYPQVREDPLFLATLVFRLRRLGVTSLIVDSDTGRPGRGETNPFSAALRSLSDHQIYTWNVPFFGEERVAISVIPPLSRGPNGVIRELRFRNPGPGIASGDSSLVVDSHFELYAGLEDGKPIPVPLQVLFYRETAAIEKYVNADLPLFSRFFTPLEGSPVMKLLNTREYIGLKDYCQLPTYTRLDHTLVFMIDDYWASAPNGALRPQTEYLYTPIEALREEARTSGGEHAETNDVFELFRDTAEPVGPGSEHAGRRCKRRHFFEQVDGTGKLLYAPRLRGSKTERDPKPAPVDRVPFLWDFGFLVCNPEHWEDAKAIELEVWNQSRAGTPPLTVEQIWNDLRRLDLRPKEEDPAKIVGWREFLEAACEVAAFAERVDGERALPLDISLGKPESIACIVMEIWFSEIRKDLAWVDELLKIGTGPGERGEHLEEPLRRAANCWKVNTQRQLGELSKQQIGDLIKLQDLVWPLNEQSLPSKNTAPAADATQDNPGAKILADSSICDGCSNFAHASSECRREYLAHLELKELLRIPKEKRGEDWKQEIEPAERWERKACPRRALLLRIWPLRPGDVAMKRADAQRGEAEEVPALPIAYPLQFYKTWLLLLEVLDFNRYLDDEHPFEIRSDYEPQLDAVAIRHWYKTASTPVQLAGGGAAATHAQQHGRVPVRLPGYYSMRGDWHLAVARGSRSDKLADRALDILSSRRANRTRLHMGVGLPTRDISSGSKIEKTRTLLKTSRKGEPPRTVSYGELLNLGGKFLESSEELAKPEFHWLFRTGFDQYERQSAVLLCWLHRLFSWTIEYRNKSLNTWCRQSGFRAYDDLEAGRLHKVSEYESYANEFPALLQGLVRDLRSACRSTK